MTWAMSRRVARRRLLLKPTPFVSELLLYVLGVAKYGRKVAVHAFLANSTHYHVVYSDLSAPGEPSEIPAFFQHLNSLLARSLNCHFGTAESFWSPGGPRDLEIWNERGVEEQLYYTWANVVQDGLVPSPADWPGAQFLPHHLGTTLTIRKPQGAFFGGRGREAHPPTSPDALALRQAELLREEQEALARGREQDRRQRAKGKGPTAQRSRELDRQRRNRVRRRQEEDARVIPPERDRSALPDEVTLTVEVPPGYEDWPVPDVYAYFQAGLDRHLEQVHAQREREGLRTFRGLAKILSENPLRTAGPVRASFGRQPRVVCPGDTELRLQVLRDLQEWRRAYRAAWLARQDPDAALLPFPLGTYQLLRFHRVEIEGRAVPPERAAA